MSDRSFHLFDLARWREMAGEGCGWEELSHGGGGVYDGRGWCEGFRSAVKRSANGAVWLLQLFTDT